MKTKITKRTVDRLAAGAIEDTIIADVELRGFTAQRLPSGKISFAYRKKGRWLRLGLFGELTAEQARQAAQRAAGAVASGNDPFLAKATRRVSDATTVNQVIDSFLANHVRRRELRSAHDMERRFDRHVRPVLGALPIQSVARPQVIALCDKVAEVAGSTEAHTTWGAIRQCFNFWMLRDPAYTSPLNVRGVSWIVKRERARSRVLNDDEIRDLRCVLDAVDPEVARFVWGLLLSGGRRRSELANMVWEEVDSAAALWTIPRERSKSKREVMVPVVPEFAALLGKPRAAGKVFQMSRFSTRKRQIDQAITALREREGRPPMAPWCWHDLRRTARTALARCGVADEVAERILGHQVGGILGATYNRHRYVAEMRDGLERLVALIGRIVSSDSNVVPLIQPLAATA
jgi:integrase